MVYYPWQEFILLIHSSSFSLIKQCACAAAVLLHVADARHRVEAAEDYLCREVGSNLTQSALEGRGWDRPGTLLWSCRTVRLMSHCIPAYLNQSVQGDPSGNMLRISDYDYERGGCNPVVSSANCAFWIMQAVISTSFLLHHNLGGMFPSLCAAKNKIKYKFTCQVYYKKGGKNVSLIDYIQFLSTLLLYM